MLINGPLGLNWRRRKYGVLPRLENGELSGVNPAVAERLKLWLKIGVHVVGRPEWIVVKVHTHGAVSANMRALTGRAMADFHAGMGQMCGELGVGLHYVSARELFNIMRAAEDGCSENPGQYRDYEVMPNR
jgi:hypothetical protein